MAASGLRSPDDSPRPPGGTAPGPATLAGMTGGEEGGPGEAPTPEGGGPGGGMTAMLGQALQTLMKTEATMIQLARQFPAAAPSLESARTGMRQAIDGLRAATKQVMTSPGQPEPPAPNIGG